MDLKKLLECYTGDESNPRIGAPWSDGDYSYATNGFSLIRVPRLDEVPVRVMPKAVNYRKVLEQFPIPTDGWMKVPTLDDMGIVACPRCKGKASDPDVCPECFGDGNVELENDHNTYDMTCKTCGGDGEVNGCRKCHGLGYIAPERISIGALHFTPSYILDFLLAFPNAEVSLPSSSDIAAWFRCQGAEMLIMPLKFAVSA